MKRPSFQFYPGDWLRDTALRSVSVGARGLWIDMIALMHDGNPYGHLKVGEKVILPPNLARIVGATLAETEGWLAELEDAGVFSRTPDGCIFSRRMIRDEEIRLKRSEGGVKGGNPLLLKLREDNQKVQSKDNLPPNLEITPSSSSSSSSSSSISPCSPPMGDPESTEPSKKDILKENAKRVIQVLNECTGSQFRCSDGNLKLITARLEEDGVDLDGVLKMVRRQSMVWGSDEKMAAYLRPETLFNKTKFESYYANREMPATNGPAVAAKACSEPRTFNDQMALFIRNKQLKANVQS